MQLRHNASARYVVIVLLAALCWGNVALAQSPQPAKQTLKIATIERQPFSMSDGDTRAGFSIDLWQALAKELGVKTEFVTTTSFPEMLGKVKNGEVDAAIANISITSQREAVMDFSQPIFDSGLQVMVRTDGASGGILSALLTWELFSWLVFAAVLLFVIANLMWLFERKVQPYFEYSYKEGMWRSFWWALNVIVNGGFEERIPKSWPGRFFAVTLIVASLFIVSVFVAKITATLTVGELRSQIQGYADLYGKRVGSTSGSTSAAFLKSKAIRIREFPDVTSLFTALERKQLDAIVHDAPILAYYAATSGRGRVRTVGEIFKAEKYGIALPQGSKLLEPLNRKLLHLRENAIYQELIQKWFGESYP